jgi:hypothetical protein
MRSTRVYEISSATPRTLAFCMVRGPSPNFATMTNAQLFRARAAELSFSDVTRECSFSLGRTRDSPRDAKIPSIGTWPGPTQTRGGCFSVCPNFNLPENVCLHLGAIVMFSVALTSHELFSCSSIPGVGLAGVCSSMCLASFLSC